MKSLGMIIILKPVIKPCNVTPKLFYSKLNTETKPCNLLLFIWCVNVIRYCLVLLLEF